MPRRAATQTSRARSVALPHSEFLDQGHIRTICTRVQFAADGLSPRQRLRSRERGHAATRRTARARSTCAPPTMSSPTWSPISTRGPIEIVLVARIDSVHGGIRSTVEGTPDAPLASYTLHMQGGKRASWSTREPLRRRPPCLRRLHRAERPQSRSKPVLGDSCKKKRSTSTTGSTGATSGTDMPRRPGPATISIPAAPNPRSSSRPMPVRNAGRLSSSPPPPVFA